MARDSSRISPTAHYTAYVWFQHGISDAALATPLGRFFHAALVVPNALCRAAGLADLDTNLLARHRVIDERLERAIADGRVAQVIEVAAGLSPRGARFVQRHPELRYVEADLPPMAAHKRELLRAGDLLGARHEVVPIDALADDGPLSLAALAERLDATVGTAIVTEGLINYFDRDTTERMWQRFARVLSRFPAGLYLSDDIFAGDVAHSTAMRVFGAALAAFARGFHVHHASAEACHQALLAAGFTQAQIHVPGEREVIRVLEASVGAS
jgi:O-methyltransferase involved in polyketide biosynthesis